VRLAGGRQQLNSHLIVHLNNRLDDLLFRIPDGFAELSIEVAHELSENRFDGFLVEIGVGDDIEMSHDSVGDKGATSSRRTHRCQDNKSFQTHPLKVFAVVPALVVQVLSDQFDGRLSSILFFFGHVHIVNKDDALLTDGRSVDSLPEFVYLIVDSVLGLVASGLCRKDHRDILILISQFFGEKLVDVERFSCPCGSAVENVLFIADQQLKEVNISGRVACGDHYLVILSLGVDG
jgi:hypothetical protein